MRQMHWDIMKVKQMFKQKMFEMFFRQPTGCMPWQHTAEVLCGKWVDLGVAVGFAVSASKCSQNFVSSIVPTCANMCHYVPAWANIAVCQLCRDRRPLWNSHDGVCVNAMVFVPMAKARRIHPCFQPPWCRFSVGKPSRVRGLTLRCGPY